MEIDIEQSGPAEPDTTEGQCAGYAIPSRFWLTPEQGADLVEEMRRDGQWMREQLAARCPR